MHKKLMAAAVAGALAVPALAVAQSTVQIYGQAEFEYGRLDQGKDRPSTDYFESTGSYLGFRGTENLGGGLQAWFQCETTMDIRAFDQVGLCSRNSGLGFRGGFGNFWAGRWHTPFSRIYGMGSPGVEETGLLGFSGIHGGSGSTSLVEQGSGNAGSLNRQRFRRRESCLVTYETPNFSGFMVGGAVSCGNGATPDSGTDITDATKNDKARLYSIAGTYIQGPLGLGIGYQKHQDVGPRTAIGPELDDRAWGASAKYTFGPVTVGATYMDRKWETVQGHVKHKTWTAAAEWNIAGPHVLMAAYGDTDDAKGEGTIGRGAAGSSGTELGGTNNSGYSTIALGYKYNMSKRTSIKVGWTRYDNDSNSASHRAFSSASLLGTGQELDNYAVVVKHRF